MKSKFLTEADVCSQFIKHLPSGWTAYNETCGFDILLVRDEDGVQIGVEAKQTLNAKVLLQAIEGVYSSYRDDGPDYRAALVPDGTASPEMKSIARRLGVTVIEVMSEDGNEYHTSALGIRYGIRNYREKTPYFKPELPSVTALWNDDRYWIDRAPFTRCSLPDYVPDVVAGRPSPSTLSDWKIKAIKVAITLEKRGYVTIKDFVHLKINRQRWLDMGWIKLTEIRGRYVAGVLTGFKRQHPKNYDQIAADWEKWMPPEQLSVLEDLPAATPTPTE